VLRDWQAEFGEDFLHIFPDLSAIIRRVISQQIGWMICRHKLNRGLVDSGIVLEELAPQPAYRFGGVQKCFGSVGAQSYDDFGFNYLNLSLKIRQAAYYLIGARVSIARWTALKDIGDKDITSFKAAGNDYLIQ
jgi:hypothetical protein